MKRYLAAAACLVAPAAILATAAPAQAAPMPVSAGQISATHINAVSKMTKAGASPMYTLRSSSQKCGGTLIIGEKVLDKQTKKLIGELDVWSKYQPATKSYAIIACFKHAGVTKGVRTQTTVSLAAAKTKQLAMAGKYVVGVKAYGNFISYAGPAAIGGFKGTSYAVATGTIKVGKKTIVAPPLAVYIKK